MCTVPRMTSSPLPQMNLYGFIWNLNVYRAKMGLQWGGNYLEMEWNIMKVCQQLVKKWANGEPKVSQASQKKAKSKLKVK